MCATQVRFPKRKTPPPGASTALKRKPRKKPDAAATRRELAEGLPGGGRLWLAGGGAVVATLVGGLIHGAFLFWDAAGDDPVRRRVVGARDRADGYVVVASLSRAKAPPPEPAREGPEFEVIEVPADAPRRAERPAQSTARTPSVPQPEGTVTVRPPHSPADATPPAGWEPVPEGLFTEAPRPEPLVLDVPFRGNLPVALLASDAGYFAVRVNADGVSTLREIGLSLHEIDPAGGVSQTEIPLFEPSKDDARETWLRSDLRAAIAADGGLLAVLLPGTNVVGLFRPDRTPLLSFAPTAGPERPLEWFGWSASGRLLTCSGGAVTGWDVPADGSAPTAAWATFGGYRAPAAWGPGRRALLVSAGTHADLLAADDGRCVARLGAPFPGGPVAVPAGAEEGAVPRVLGAAVDPAGRRAALAYAADDREAKLGYYGKPQSAAVLLCDLESGDRNWLSHANLGPGIGAPEENDFLDRPIDRVAFAPSGALLLGTDVRTTRAGVAAVGEPGPRPAEVFPGWWTALGPLRWDEDGKRHLFPPLGDAPPPVVKEPTVETVPVRVAVKTPHGDAGRIALSVAADIKKKGVTVGPDGWELRVTGERNDTGRVEMDRGEIGAIDQYKLKLDYWFELIDPAGESVWRNLVTLSAEPDVARYGTRVDGRGPRAPIQKLRVDMAAMTEEAEGRLAARTPRTPTLPMHLLRPPAPAANPPAPAAN